MSEQVSVGGRDPRKITGGVLIVIGLFLFILQMTKGVTVSLMYLVGGIAFLVAYFSKRTYGFLIPGCILAGMGLGQLGEQYIESIHNPTYVGLGVGFLAIFLIDRIYRGATAWWPLIPGGILLLMGLETGGFNLGTILTKGWPLVLVIIGILYVTGRLGSGRRGEGDGPSEPE